MIKAEVKHEIYRAIYEAVKADILANPPEAPDGDDVEEYYRENGGLSYSWDGDPSFNVMDAAIMDAVSDALGELFGFED